MLWHWSIRGIAALGAVVLIFVGVQQVQGLVGSFSQLEPGTPQEDDSLLDALLNVDPYVNWERPDGPPRVGIQVGHWKAAEAPDEQEGLRDNTGAQAAGFTEWETNLHIAEITKARLEAAGVVVDLFPVTIPPGYVADAFISIHADGNMDGRVHGYKIAPPWRDRSGNAAQLSDLIEESYGAETGLAIDPNISRNMRGYYAFNWRRYEHAIHPMTPAAIVETGFLTNANDRRVIVHRPDISAKGIAAGVMRFLAATVPDDAWMSVAR